MSNKEISVDSAVQLLEMKTEVAFKYGVNLSSRVIQLVGDITEGSFIHVDTALTLLEEESKAAVTLRINSEGGSMYDALAIIGRLKGSKCKIITEGYGCIMSAASLILASGSRRRMSRYATFMHHEGSVGFEGTVKQVEHMVNQMKREDVIWCAHMGRFTSHSAEYWADKGNLGIDFFLTAEECEAHGVVDEVF